MHSETLISLGPLYVILNKEPIYKRLKMREPGGGKVFHSKMASKVPKVSRKRVVMEQVPNFLVLF